MSTSVWQRVLRALVVIGLVTGGSTVFIASAAHAAIGGCNNYDTTSACINYGNTGQAARLDFYQNRPPGQAYYSYKAYIIANGNWHLVKQGLLDHTGRYCCWTHTTDALPAILWTVRSRIEVFSQGGGLHIISESPVIQYYS